MRHRQRRRERFGNKGKWQEKKRNILEQKHKTEDNTHTHTDANPWVEIPT